MSKTLILFLIIFSFTNLHASQEEDFRNSIKLFSDKNYQGSIELLKSLTAQTPTNGLYWFNLGNAYYMSEQYEKAVDSYQKAEQLILNLKPAARLYMAKGLAKLGRSKEASSLLQELRAKNTPENITKEATTVLLDMYDGDFSKGMDLYESQQYQDALGIFSNILNRHYSSESEFMVALCFLKMGDEDKSLDHFENILKNSRDTKIKKDAGSFVEEILNLKKGKQQYLPLYTYIKAGAGYNSNVYLDGGSDSPEGKCETNVQAGIGYKFFSMERFSFEPTYSLMWDEIINVSSLRFMSHMFEFNFYYNYEDWFFRVTPLLEYQHFDATADLYKPGVFAIIGYNIVKDQELGLVYSVYNDNTKSSYYNYLNGNEHAVKVFWGIKPENMYIGINYGYFLQNTGDLSYSDGTILPFAYKAHGPELRMGFYSGGTWEIYSVLSYLFKSYKNLAIPDNEKRSDKTFSVYAEIQKELVEALKFFVSINAIINSSNLVSTNTYDENYRQFKFLGGLKWELRR